MDYKALSEILTFGVCEMRQCVNVSIVDDMIHEPEERFSYTLERTIDLDPLIAINPSAGEVVIVDDDGIVFVNKCMKFPYPYTY